MVLSTWFFFQLSTHLSQTFAAYTQCSFGICSSFWIKCAILIYISSYTLLYMQDLDIVDILLLILYSFISYHIMQWCLLWKKKKNMAIIPWNRAYTFIFLITFFFSLPKKKLHEPIKTKWSIENWFSLKIHPIMHRCTILRELFYFLMRWAVEMIVISNFLACNRIFSYLVGENVSIYLWFLWHVNCDR